MNGLTIQPAERPPEMAQTVSDEHQQPITIKKKPVYAFIKRFADIVLSLLASLVLLIPITVVAIMIVWKNPGNPFYLHTRVGKGHKPIRVMKLRTMRKGADKLENMLTPEQLEEYRREYKIHDDPRLIGWKKPGDGDKCFGAKLRRASLDEIMQIPYNILLKGNMSFVGPRPIMEDELQKYYTPEQQELLLSVKPGLTGMWQVTGRNDCTYESGGRQKAELQYISEKGIWTDVKIMFKTVGTILQRGGYTKQHNNFLEDESQEKVYKVFPILCT